MTSLLSELKDRMTSEYDNLTSFNREFGESNGAGGFVPFNARRNPVQLRRSIELMKLMNDVNQGKMRSVWFEEAMTTSDFPQLFGFTVERILLDRYQLTPQTWASIARRRTVPDFRNIEVKRRSYGGGTRLSKVMENQEYPVASLVEQSPLTYKVHKYGEIMTFSFELGVGDVLGELENIPQEMGQAVRETENYAATELYAGSTGPNTTLYTAPRANIVTSNPP